MTYLKWLSFLLIVSVLSLCTFGSVRAAPNDKGGVVYVIPHHNNMTLVKITRNMYVIAGKVGSGDCKRIIPLLPSRGHFTVILESPGGSLTEGMCFAENFKRLAVTTVVRETPILSPWELLGSNLGQSWAMLGPSWGYLGRAWGLLGSTLKLDHQT